MNRILLILVAALAISEAMTKAQGPETPFHRGVNLANWFQNSNSISTIHFNRFTREDFKNIQALGIDHIRLPLQLTSFMGAAPDYLLEPLFFRFLDNVIGWSEDLGLTLILDNHSDDLSTDPDSETVNKLIALWTQIARRYQGRSEILFYEILNAPDGISDDDWNDLLQPVIDAIREIDSNRYLIVGPAGGYSCIHLKHMSLADDPHLIYTFHFYDPILFTEMGTGWSDPEIQGIDHLPYPYDASRMPPLPEDCIGTWIGAEYQIYPSKGTDVYIRSLLDIAVRFGFEKQAPLWCSEFGAFMSDSNTEDRARWYQTVRKYLESNQISWCLWEYHDEFGLFEPGSLKRFGSDLNIPLVEALGLVSPPQSPSVMKPDSSGMVIYDDYIGKRITETAEFGTAFINYYSEENPYSGDYCISWIPAEQNNSLNFSFSPAIDLTWLVSEDYRLNFWISGNSDSTVIDVRFIDTDNDDPDDHPWRMRYTIDEETVHDDGTWQHIMVPLINFTEQGAWEGEWFTPQGKFDWSKVEYFQIIAESSAMLDKILCFDEIRISTGSEPHTEITSGSRLPDRIQLRPVYPNPFNGQAVLSFSLPDNCEVKIGVYNVNGQLIQSLANERFGAGEHDLTVHGENLSSGIYLVRLSAGDVNLSQRILLLK